MNHPENQQINEKESTQWHELFGNMFKEMLIPLDLDVESNYPVTKGPVKLDVLIIKRKYNHWTEAQLNYLPDGIRDSKCKYNILELKYTESVDKIALCQTLGYYGQYIRLKKVDENDVHSFLVSAKTPNKETLKAIGYVPTKIPGVYKNNNNLPGLVTLLSLNDLSEEPYNIWIKLFSSKKKQKLAALKQFMNTDLSKIPEELKDFIKSLLIYWNDTGEYKMKQVRKDLSPALFPSKEAVKRFYSDLIGSHTPKEILSYYDPKDFFSNFEPKDVISYYDSKDFFSNFEPKDVISTYDPNDVLDTFSPSQIAEYLENKKVKKRRIKKH